MCIKKMSTSIILVGAKGEVDFNTTIELVN